MDCPLPAQEIAEQLEEMHVNGLDESLDEVEEYDEQLAGTINDAIDDNDDNDEDEVAEDIEMG